MVKNLVMLPKLSTSFYSCEKDAEIILRRLFIESQPYSDLLKRLLVINTPDCIDDLERKEYKDKIKTMTLSEINKQGYIRMRPRIRMNEHQEVKTFIILSFDGFTTNSTNPEFRDCIVNFDVFSHTDCWDLGDYRSRPLKVCGIIDAILNTTKLTGIGEFLFMGCNEVVLNEDWAGYSLMFSAIHFTDDRLPPNG